MTELDGALDIDAENDIEVDPADLGDAIGAPEQVGAPSVVVADLHVTFRVFGGRPLDRGEGASPMRRLANRYRKHVGGAHEVHAVRGISFVAHHGESIGIIGINGSGKSTLLRAVAGLIPPTDGEVYVAADPALLGVNAVLMRELSGERNIMIGGLALGLSRHQVLQRFDQVVEFSGIGDFVYLPMKTYSAGMASRLRFAISSIVTPDILMIDEALATGDAAFRRKSKERIAQIRDQAGTVFLVSHSLATIQATCSRVLWVHEGRLRMDGPARDVCLAYKEFVHSKEYRESRKG